MSEAGGGESGKRGRRIENCEEGWAARWVIIGHGSAGTPRPTLEQKPNTVAADVSQWRKPRWEILDKVKGRFQNLAFRK